MRGNGDKPAKIDRRTGNKGRNCQDTQDKDLIEKASNPQGWVVTGKSYCLEVCKVSRQGGYLSAGLAGSRTGAGSAPCKQDLLKSVADAAELESMILWELEDQLIVEEWSLNV